MLREHGWVRRELRRAGHAHDHEHYDVAADPRGTRALGPARTMTTAWRRWRRDIPGVFDALGWRDAYMAGHSDWALVADQLGGEDSPAQSAELFAEPIVPTRFRRTAGSAGGSRRGRRPRGGRRAAYRPRGGRGALAFTTGVRAWDPACSTIMSSTVSRSVNYGSVALRARQAIEVQVFEASADFDDVVYLRDVRSPVPIVQAERAATPASPP